MTTKTNEYQRHEFSIGDGYFGIVEWTENYEESTPRFFGTMYVTCEYAPGVVMYAELDEYFADRDDMLKYVEDFIRREYI